jgi:mono/diheme cytochrome c family protein/uncharacterized membrane protein
MLSFLGHFHPLLVHLPIGILLLAVLFARLGRREKFAHLQAVVPITLLLGTFSAILSCFTGYWLSLSGEYDVTVLDQHRYLGIAVAVWGSLMWIFNRSALIQKRAWLFQLLLVVLISVAGHWGGSLTHGSDYLVQELPEPYRTWLGVPASAAKVQKFDNIPEANAYAAVVAPLLQEKCINCHGATKQKGKLRLDNPEFIQKGGKNGQIIIAGKVADSELMRRLLLPKSDDEHMPPKEKNQLTEAEVKLLHWWIETGAAFDKKVKDLPQTAEVTPLFAALQNGSNGTPVPEPSIWPTIQFNQPDAKAIAALKAAGAVVLPLGQNENMLSVNFINLPKAGAKEVALLKGVAQNLVSLRLSGVAIGDQELKAMVELPYLTKLFLDGTKITDAGLEKFAAAKYLNYLNVVNTQVSRAGLEKLKAVGSLREIYAYQTKLKGQEDWRALKKVLPKVTIDTGGYQVVTLPTDTVLVTEAPAKPK